jgi:hypothetical protein
VPPELSDIIVCTLPSCVVVMPLSDHQVGHTYEYLAQQEALLALVLPSRRR